jgi:hypothetical protein
MVLILNLKAMETRVFKSVSADKRSVPANELCSVMYRDSKGDEVHIEEITDEHLNSIIRKGIRLQRTDIGYELIVAEYNYRVTAGTYAKDRKNNLVKIWKAKKGRFITSEKSVFL